jgi:hypothetical protein
MRPQGVPAEDHRAGAAGLSETVQPVLISGKPRRINWNKADSNALFFIQKIDEQPWKGQGHC